MKKNVFFILMLCIMLQNCFGKDERTSQINFFQFIKPLGISLGNCFLNQEISIPYFLFGFDMYETNKNGTGVFFAIPKKEFGVWKTENLSELKKEDLWKNNRTKIMNAENLLSTLNDTLLLNFDLYVFYVKQNDIQIEGAYMSDDGKSMDDYYVKDNARIYTYVYKNDGWIKINETNVQKGNIKEFGEKVIEKLLKKQI